MNNQYTSKLCQNMLYIENSFVMLDVIYIHEQSISIKSLSKFTLHLQSFVMLFISMNNQYTSKLCQNMLYIEKGFLVLYIYPCTINIHQISIKTLQCFVIDSSMYVCLSHHQHLHLLLELNHQCQF